MNIDNIDFQDESLNTHFDTYLQCFGLKRKAQSPPPETPKEKRVRSSPEEKAHRDARIDEMAYAAVQKIAKANGVAASGKEQALKARVKALPLEKFKWE